MALIFYVAEHLCLPPLVSLVQKAFTLIGISSNPTHNTLHPLKHKGLRNHYVVGLLALTSLKLDHWQAVDYVALCMMLSCLKPNSLLLCAADINQGPGSLLGDPACD
jgi:hypothetical protein